MNKFFELHNKALPTKVCLISSVGTFPLSAASLSAVAASCDALHSLKFPLNEPMGVLTADNMNKLDSKEVE